MKYLKKQDFLARRQVPVPTVLPEDYRHEAQVVADFLKTCTAL